MASFLIDTITRLFIQMRLMKAIHFLVDPYYLVLRYLVIIYVPVNTYIEICQTEVRTCVSEVSNNKS